MSVLLPQLLPGMEEGVIDYGPAEAATDTASPSTEGSAMDHIIQLVLGLLLIMGLVAASALVLRAWQKGGLRRFAGRRHMEVVESMVIGPKRSVVLVKVAGRALVLGCGEEVRLLESLPAEAIRDLHSSQATESPTDSDTTSEPETDTDDAADPGTRLSAFKQRLQQHMGNGS